jgi:hypothetical protein
MKILLLIAISSLAFASELIQRALLQSYPNHIEKIENNLVYFTNGNKVLFDDFETKDFYNLLKNADIEDQFKIIYPLRDSFSISKNHDPGRIRNEEFFKNIYGSNKKEVKNNLVVIDWLPNLGGGKVKMTKIMGCADSLKKVSNELEKLPIKFHKYLMPLGGGFNYRNISGTDRLSNHSFGISIDINVKHSNYWRWAKNKDSIIYKNKIPLEIVKIFEKYGFIWGGKWYHFDTMHFEFRPELILFSRLVSE